MIFNKKIENGKLQDWERNVYEFVLNWFDTSDFIVQHTSGSTGAPKSIQLKKNAMKASAQMTIDFFGLKEKNTAWLCLPVNYIAGKMMVVRALVGNLHLIISPAEGTPIIPDIPVHFTAMVPLQIQQLLLAGADFSSIQKIIIGGAAVDTKLSEKLKQVSSDIFATYGMTETCSHIALQKLNGENPDEQFRVLPSVKISQNQEGCLVIDAPHLLVHKLVTNDIVELGPRGTFRVLGRSDNVINSGGIKIFPEKLERIISKLIDRECVIVPQRDDRLGQKTVLVLEGKSNNQLSDNTLKTIKSHLDKHQAPKSVYYVNQFPRTESMKIDRRKVIELLNT